MSSQAPKRLKILEAPPPSTVFVILTDDVPPELVTLASPAVRIAFPPVPHDPLVPHLVAGGIAAVFGFYAGFFGPGTGSVFMFLMGRLVGYDFLKAAAGAKLLNTASNLAAILLCALKGHVWWHFVLAMAIANVLGSLAGTHLALKHGTGFVRGVFIFVVSALILKTSYDAFLR